MPEEADIENYFFYLALQPVQDGLVDRISDYPGYNCFNDAVSGIERSFKVVDWGRYNDTKRWDQDVKLEDFTTEVTLNYTRLPGYEDLSPQNIETSCTKSSKRGVLKSLIRDKNLLPVQTF